MHYLIGDPQGCCDAFERLLLAIDFSPSRDHVHVLGDLVNRGPQSLAMLLRLKAMAGCATCLLGNHDIHLLALDLGVRAPGGGDTLDEILAHPQRIGLMHWLRQQPLADMAHGWLLVHAGVVPQWDAAQTLALAAEAQAVLAGAQGDEFLRHLYGDRPRQWDSGLAGHDRHRFIINVLTRMRFCTAEGQLDFETKEGLAAAPPGYLPWFELPLRHTHGQPIAFGHWSSLGLINRPDLLALDTGCVWGRSLSAARIDGGRREVIQVDCAGELGHP